MRRPTAPQPKPAVMTYITCASYLGLPSANALRQMASRGTGPPSIAYGKRDVHFRVVDVDRWLAAKSAAVAKRAAIAEAKEPPSKRRRGRPTKAEEIARRD